MLKIVILILANIFLFLAGLIAGILVSLEGTTGVKVADMNAIFRLQNYYYPILIISILAMSILFKKIATKIV